jgi:hypothetical protein
MEMLKGKPPNLTHIVAFGSSCMVYHRKPGMNSLKKRAQRGLILGESEEVKGSRVYLMENSIDPSNYNVPMKSAAVEHWKTAIVDELKSLGDNIAWIVVEKPPDAKPLVSRLVFKLTLDSNGAIKR